MHFVSWARPRLLDIEKPLAVQHIVLLCDLYDQLMTLPRCQSLLVLLTELFLEAFNIVLIVNPRYVLMKGRKLFTMRPDPATRTVGAGILIDE